MGRATRDGAGTSDPIEFLAPRDFVFGSDSPAEFAGINADDLPEPDDDEPRSRWLAAAAGLALTALIAVGVVAAAPWDTPTATPTPSTTPDAVPRLTAPPTTDHSERAQPADPAVVGDDPTDVVVPAEPLTGMVFDPLPSGFAVRSAWSNDEHWDDPQVSGWGEVYATPEATRISGAWYSITLVNFQYPSLSPTATRVDLGGRVGLLDQAADGTKRLTASIGQTDSTQTLSITSHGRSEQQVVALFNSIGIDDDRPQLADDRPKYLDPTQLQGFNLVASRATDQDLLDTFQWGLTDSNTYYSDGTGEQFISVETSERDTSLEPLGRLAIGPLRIVPDTADVPITFTGQDLVLGVSPSGSDPTITARWHTADTTISVRSTLPLDVLLQLLPTLRVAAPDEWLVVKRRAMADQTEIADQNGEEVFGPSLGIGIPVAKGSSTTGIGWSVMVQPPGWASLQVGEASIMFQTTQSHGLEVWTANAISIATAFVDADSPAQTMRVTVGGHDVNVKISALAESGAATTETGRVAAVAFEDTGPYRVELLDVNGVVVAEIDSSALPAEGS